jgi:Amt family ammonium transporter
MTAATLVGLMSIPALAVLYGGLVQRKWAMNTVLMVFTTFCLVLITWVLWGFKLGFGTPLISTFLGDPRTVLGHAALQGQASIPLVNGLVPSWHLPGASVIYFQFVFAAITPILFIGSVLGRISWSSCRCGSRSPTASTRSCSGAAASGRARARWTSPAVTSSTWRPAHPASSPPR